MLQGERKYVLVLVLAVAAAVTIELVKPEPVDWTVSLEADDTRPYGGRVLYEVLPALFPGEQVHAVDLPIYLMLRDTTGSAANYVFVTRTFAPDDLEARALVRFAEGGGHVLIAADDIGGLLADTLGVQVRSPVGAPGSALEPAPDTLGVNFVAPGVKTPEGYAFREGIAAGMFSAIDSSRTTVLGINSRGEANFVRVDAGDGSFYLSALPLAFTNFFMLAGDHAGYVYRALSYLPDRDVWWDAYYKPNRRLARTPLRYVLSDPALRWAYWTLVALVVAVLVFEARRRQRIIPVVAPPRNDTLEFVQTVGRLYYQHGDHTDLAKKKVTYFRDYLRSRLRIPVGRESADLVARVSERSGVPRPDVQRAFDAVAIVEQRDVVTESELRHVSAAIESFYSKSIR